MQVEELVAGSNTGKAPQLCYYYSYWEMAVFNTLVLMVLKGLEKLHSMLTKKPLFKASNPPCCAFVMLLNKPCSISCFLIPFSHMHNQAAAQLSS